MNLTIEMFIAGLETSTESLPELLIDEAVNKTAPHTVTVPGD